MTDDAVAVSSASYRQVSASGDVRFQYNAVGLQTGLIGLVCGGTILASTTGPWWLISAVSVLMLGIFAFSARGLRRSGVTFAGNNIVVRSIRSRTYAADDVSGFDVRPRGNSPAEAHMVLTDRRVVPIDGVATVRASTRDTQQQLQEVVDAMNAELLIRKRR